MGWLNVKINRRNQKRENKEEGEEEEQCCANVRKPEEVFRKRQELRSLEVFIPEWDLNLKRLRSIIFPPPPSLPLSFTKEIN